ncbi:hypothetical protein DXG03_004707, partial [Asterophora parasitica]
MPDNVDFRYPPPSLIDHIDPEHAEGYDDFFREIPDTGPQVDDIAGNEELLPELRKMLDTLTEGKAAPHWVALALKEQHESCFLDTSRVCFPNVLIAGEGKQSDSKSALVQSTVYMRQARRTQPWRRFTLGLISTRDELGLLRADAVGIEECVFAKNIGRGVIETIRLALGIMLANDSQLGKHPAFELRDAITPLIPGDDVATGAKRQRPVDDAAETGAKKSRLDATTTSISKQVPPEPQQYRYREANFINLSPLNLHAGTSAAPPSIFYVKHLIEDRGSLVGRSTRIWCVYQEDPDENLRKEHCLPSSEPVYVGPYALK